MLKPSTVDVDGDGLTDLTVSTGVWVSTGDGNFTQLSQSFNVSCGFPLDFNGDGRMDCFTPAIDGTASGQTLQVMTGSVSGTALPTVAGFNLKTNGANELYAPNTGAQTIGTLFGDFNGDGRTDILRWENDPTLNVMYLSNGDGTFSTSNTFNLKGTAQGLQNSDGKTAYVAGDFRGIGALEILRMKDSPSATSEATGNQLYVRNNPTPPDLLLTVNFASGLKTTLTWVPLTSATPPAPDDIYGSRYKSDRFDTANPLQPGQVNLSIPLYVVAKTVSDSGVGSATVATQYNYAGLKASNDGRGLLGFRETKRQSPAPDGSASFLTVDTQFLQIYPYTGVASKTSSYQGTLTTPIPSSPLSSTTYAYCDKSVTSTTPTPAVPCPVTAKMQRPLLYQSVASGSDIDGSAFPTVTTTNTFDAFGSATNIAVQTVGTVLGTNQTVTKTTGNVYDNDTSGDYWVLGRLRSATQRNVVQDFLANIPVTAGTAANASANQGTGTLPAAPPTFSPSLSAPTFSSTTVGASTTGVATLTNGGGSPGALTVPTASSVSGTDFSFLNTSCSTTLPAGGSCGITVKFLPTAAATRTGTVTVITQVGTQTVSFSGVGTTAPTSPALTFNSCTASPATTTPTAATYSCTLSNVGQTNATSVGYGVSIGGATVTSGPGSCAVGTCGTVVVTTSTAAGTYSGTLTATPNVGSAATSPFNLQVNTAASLALSTPSFSSTMVGTPTTGVATLTNSGGSAATVTAAASSVTGADFSFGSTTCGSSLPAGGSCTVTVNFTPTAAGTRTGSLAIGTQVGTQTVSLSGVGLSPPALSLTCTPSSPTTTPTAATYSCTLSNVGQTNATSVGYGVSIGTASVTSGPNSCAVGTCGTVVVTTSTAAGTYSGTLTATPNVGSAANSTFSLQVYAVPIPFNFVSSSAGPNFITTFSNPNSYAMTPTASGVRTTDRPPSITTNTCSSAVAAGGTCAINFTAPTPDCKLDNYTVTPYVTNSAGTTNGVTIPITTTKSPCP